MARCNHDPSSLPRKLRELSVRSGDVTAKYTSHLKVGSKPDHALV